MAAPVWLIVPTYNEAPNLERLLPAVLEELGRASPEGFRVLVVDDASPDGTGRLADELAARHEPLEILHRPRRKGIGPAYLAGFARALADEPTHVLQMDADLSHDPADLRRLLEAARAGADVVLGSRYVPGGGVADWALPRRVISRGGCWYARSVLGVPVRDLTGGFKCFAGPALRRLDLGSIRSHGYAFQVETTYRALRRGMRVVEIPIVFRERRHGESKMSARIAAEAAWRVPQLRLTARPGPRSG